MIRVRDDDVLIPSSSYSCELGRLKQIHEWICEVPDTLIHVPAICVLEIQGFPEAIEWIRQETLEGRMLPEIHGLSHKDYADLSEKEIVAELNVCRDWIHYKFGHVATKFYSPWGAGADMRGAHIGPAAASTGIELVTCEDITKLCGRYGVVQGLMDKRDISFYDGKEFFMHWWEGGCRLKRVVEVIKHGTWDEAVKHNKELFRG
jgi:hypothetical protein